MAKGKRNEAAKAARAKRNESYRKGRKPRKLYEVNCYDKDACKGYDKLTCGERQVGTPSWNAQCVLRS